METSALAIAYTEDSEYGGINSGTNDVHLSEIGVHGLDIVDAHGDEREAGRIDQHVEYGSLIVAFRPKFPPHLCQKLQGQSHHGCEYQSSRLFVSAVHPLDL